MPNPLLLLSGIGMVLVGLSALYLSRRRLGIPWSVFAFGGVAWLAAFAVKAMMDLAALEAGSLWDPFQGWDALGLLALIGAYLGLRTGLLESGLSYLFLNASDIRKDFRHALAFGIGFGAAEAVFLGVSALIDIGLLLAFPEVLNILPPGAAETVSAQLDMSTLAVVPPILERALVMVIHCFAAVLVFLSASTRRMAYLWMSVGYKAAADGMVPFLAYSLDYTQLANLYLAELPVAALAVAGVLGILWSRARFRREKVVAS
jgi:uncharacterized membrane protein YhfC